MISKIFPSSYFSQNSFLSLGKWIEELKDIGTDGMILVVVGNKADLSHNRKVRYLLLFFRCSAGR